MKKAAVVIGLMLAVTAGVMLLRGGRELAPGAPMEFAEASHASMGAPKMRLAADAVLAIAPGIASDRPRAATAAAPQVSPLMREYKAARAYKPMYERLKAAERRTPEETWVLANVLDQCAKVTDREQASKRFFLGGDEARAKFIASLSPKDPQRDKRIAAFDRVNFDPCEGLRDVKTTDKEIRGLLAEAAAAGDPRAAVDLVQADLWAQLKDSQGRVRFEPGRFASLSDAQVETLKHAVESGDPGALVSAVALLQFPMADRSMRGPDEVPVNAAAMGAAAMLIACDLGDDCGPDSKTLQQGCAMQGRCEARTYRDYLFYYMLSPETSQLVAQYQATLANAARNRDWSGFTFFRGPSPSFAPYVTR